MGCEVYANGMTIACKAADGKTVAAMPDVCLSPPSPPAGPVPLPYPNTAMASDTTDGSKTVQINGQEVMLKDQSAFKKSCGDEAATKSLGMGVVSHQIQGKVNFVSWSMDVKFEGSNVPRNLDLTIHNEMSVPANTPTWPYLDSADVKNQSGPCADEIKEEQTKCGTKPEDSSAKKRKLNPTPSACDKVAAKPTSKEEAIALTKQTEADDCLKARRCMLVPCQPSAGQAACCPGQTGHHLVEAGSWFKKGRGVEPGDDLFMLKVAEGMTDDGDYQTKDAPCICVEGANQYHGTHGLLHTFQGNAALKNGVTATVPLKNGTSASLVCQTYGQARDSGAAAASKVFKQSGCSEDCFKAQLDAYHNPDKGKPGDRENELVRSIVTGYTKEEDVAAATRVVNNGLSKFADTGIPQFRGLPI